MEHISLRLPDNLLDESEAGAAERDSSWSEYIRALLDDRPAAGCVDVDDLQAVARQLREYERERDTLDARRDELRRQVAAVNARADDHRDLAESVQEERELQRQQRQRAKALAWNRPKWWFFGQDGDEATSASDP